jgi:hypothetical protein
MAMTITTEMMDKMNNWSPDVSARKARRTPDFDYRVPNPNVHIADKRVARLLLVLHELDESVAGLEELPKSDLSELVSSAILACGFVDPVEARYAIAAVLRAIEAPGSMPECS